MRASEIRMLNNAFGGFNKRLKDTLMRIFTVFTPQLILQVDEIKKHEMGGTCTTLGRDKKCTQMCVEKTRI